MAALAPETWVERGCEPLPTPMIEPLPPPPPAQQGLFETLFQVQGGNEEKSPKGDDSDNDSAPLVDVELQRDGPVAVSQQQPESAEDAIVTGLEFLGIEQPVPGRGGQYHQEQGGGGGAGGNTDQDLLGLGTLQEGPILEETEEGEGAVTTPSERQQSRPSSAGNTSNRPSFSSLGGNSTSGNRSLMRTSVLQSLPRGSRNYISTSLEAPLAYELRYPPLNPKESAKLGVLVASNGSLFAGPSVENGLLQWSMPEGVVQEPGSRPGSGSGGGLGGSAGKKKIFGRLESDLRATHESKHPVPTEDADASFSFEISGASPRSRPTTCLLTDEARGILWVGDKDGWVAGYDITGKPGNILDPETSRLYSWQAHRVGTVAGMCLSSTGELWTGSSRGTIRVWRLHGLHYNHNHSSSSSSRKKKEKSVGGGLHHSGGSGGGGGAVGKPRELRRPAGERAHSGAIVCMVCSADGQIIWTASRKGIVLWDAYSGAYLGSLSRESIATTAPLIPTNSGVIGSGASGFDLNPLATGGAGAGTGASGMYASTHSSSFTSTTTTASLASQQQAFLDGRINVSTGLDLDPSHGAVMSRPSVSERERLVVQQESWAAQSERGVAEFAERFSEGAGRAVKLIGKLGAKLGVISSGSGGSGAAGGSPAGATTDGVVSSDGDAPIEQQTTLSGGDIVALVASLENNQIWVGYRRGFIERYTAAGKLQFARQFGGKIHTMAPVGRKLWVGFTNGMLSVLGPDGTGLKAFLAHKAGIVAIAPAGVKTYTLAADGSINGWSSAIPCIGDEDALDAWHKQASSTFVRESINVLAVTWNCGESRPESSSPVFRWLHEHGFDKSLVVIGLQEVEMGGTSVALAAAKNALASRLQEKGNANAQFWSTAMLNALGGDRHWHQVGLRQLSGMLIVAFARNNLRGHIGEIATASVACGVLGVGGNKGAVAVEFTLHRQKFAVVCSHFAAHQNAVKARNSNYAVIAKHLTFNRRAWLGGDDDDDYYSTSTSGGDQVVLQHAGRRSHVRTASSSSTKEIPSSTIGTSTGPTDLLLLSNNSSDEENSDFEDLPLTTAAPAALGDALGDVDDNLVDTSITTTANLNTTSATTETITTPNTTITTTTTTANDEQMLLQGEGLRCADALIWLGDFNYRIDGQYDQVKELAISGEFGPLLACDQLRREMAVGNVFRGLREGVIAFPPTYKFDKGVPSPAAYDSSEKRRVPAWCDRIFFRGSTPFSTPFDNSGEDSTNNDNEMGVENHINTLSSSSSSSWLAASTAGPEEICIRAREYGCWSDVYDSDHRPVYASLQVSLPVTDASKKRDLIADLVKRFSPPELILGADAEPEVTIAPSTVKVHPIHMPEQMVLLSNNGVANLTFTILIDGDDSSGGSGGGLGGGSNSSFLGDRTSGASSQVEIRPVHGFVRAGSETEIRIRASPGGAGSYASTPREVVVRILLATEYSHGGAVVEGEGRGEVEFTAVVLPEFALDDS